MDKLLRFSVPESWLRRDVIAASLSVNLLALALPFVVLQVYDRVIPNASTGTLTILALCLMAVICMDVVLRICRTAILSGTGARFEHRTTIQAMNALLHSEPSALKGYTPNTYMDQFQSVSKLRDFYSGQPAVLIMDIPFVLIFLTLITIMGGMLVLVPIGLLLIMGLRAWALSKSLRNTLDQHSQIDERRYNFLSETLGAVHTVKSLALEKVMSRRYERLQQQSALSVFDVAASHNTALAFTTFMSQLAVVSMVTFGSVFAASNQMTMGALAACTMLTGRVLQPVLRGISFWVSLQGVDQAKEKSEAILSLQSEQSHEAQIQVRPNDPVDGRIEFKRVTVADRNGSGNVLDDISLKVEPGEVIGIRGPNGCGKSVLLGLVNAMVEPSSGEVLIDDKPIEDFDIRALRQQIGYVGDKGKLFDGTILENVAMFREGEPLPRAIEVMGFLGLTEYITRLPNGLETKLSSSSADSLPMGIRQRIVIARALVNAPGVLLFDDANQGLDLQSDSQLLSALMDLKGTRTIFIACNRPSYLRSCDRIFELREGKLTQINKADLPGAAPTKQSTKPKDAPPKQQQLKMQGGKQA